MKRRVLAILLSASMLLTMSPRISWAAEGATGTNLALTATASASYTNTYNKESEPRMNDGELAAADPATGWNSWGSPDTADKAILTWEEPQQISSARVMWWADGGGVLWPASAYLEYLDGEEWKKLADVGTAHGETDSNTVWNVVNFDSVTTNSIRIVATKAEGSSGVGIGEWEVYHGTQEESAATEQEKTALQNSITSAEGKYSQADYTAKSWSAYTGALQAAKDVLAKENPTEQEVLAAASDLNQAIKGLTDKASENNLAREATATAGYTNTYVANGEKNLNDGKLATSDPSTSWNSWGAADEKYPMPLTLTWTEPQKMCSTRVMWWSDNGGVEWPVEAMLQYLDNGEWKDIRKVALAHGDANGANGVWNVVNFDEITTTGLRILVKKKTSGSTGVGVSEWEVFDQKLKVELTGAEIQGKDKLAPGESTKLVGEILPDDLVNEVSYEWSITSGSDIISIDGSTTSAEATVKAAKEGTANVHLKVTKDDVVKESDLEIRVRTDKVESIDPYITSTAAGVAPILPDTVVVNGVEFDAPSEPATSVNNNVQYGETFNSKLLPVTWEKVDASSYAKAGSTFTVKGKVNYKGTDYDAEAKITVKAPVAAGTANSTVTFENVQFENSFWTKRQEVNAMTSLGVGIGHIEEASGGEPNFDNAIKKLNGEAYEPFSGYVFQDSDIYKSLEAIAYTLSATQNDKSPEVIAKRKELSDKVESWIQKIEKVQYADGYIGTMFTLRSSVYVGGGKPGTHRWWEFSNHEMYNAGHFLEAVVAYTRYREGIGQPDYRLYVAGRRFANEIVTLFGPGGSRHEVPGHEEIELALVKFGKLAEEYEGEGAGQAYYDTAKLLIDRRGEAQNLRDSAYKAGTYSQDQTPIQHETNAVGHAVRANYYYTGITDIATILPEGDTDRDAYIKSLDTIWDSVTSKKTYITGGIGASTATSDSEGFGADYDLPPDHSYIEICAAIAAANWNQRMNLLHEDGKYADMVEKNLYNSILVGENLDGNMFFYSSLLRVAGGNGRSSWFACACCPPNLMRTIAAASGYMYTVHNKSIFVNMYSGSTGKIKVDGTDVTLKQETMYPWDGAVKLTVGLPTSVSQKNFALKLRIPGWVNEQKNKKVTIKVGGKEITGSDAEVVNGYVTIDRAWSNGDVVTLDIPMEIRRTESDEHVTSTQGMIALQRGPIVYCMEKAGNVELNPSISNFDPLNFVIPRDASLKAEYKSDLLNGCVEITGDVKYNDGSQTVDAKLQAIPYYAWNNRGDDAVYESGKVENNSSKMLIWTNAVGTAGTPADINTVQLSAAISAADSLKEADYTADTWKAFTDALDAVKKVAANANATQAELDAAQAKLDAAVSGLKAKSSNEGGQGGQGGQTEDPVVEVKVAAPTSVKAAWAGKTSVSITWKKSANAVSYNVYRSYKKNGSYQKIASNVKAASYKDTKATAGKTAYYVVSAVNGKVETKSSAAAVKVLKAPTGLKAKAKGKKVTVSFKKVAGANGYQIVQSKKKNKSFKSMAVLKSVSKVKATKKLKKGTYYFKVRAYATVNGKKVYTAYTKVVKAKVKK